MDSFLRAVGLDTEQLGLGRTTPSCSSRSRARSVGAVDESHGMGDDTMLPDLASIAAATEKGILALEEEAKTMERLALPEALALVQRWAQALRRKPKAEESLASFKAKFLRSNALERTFEGLRRNGPLREVLLDRPLFATADAGPETVMLDELQAMLQLCLPKAAGSLCGPILQAVLTEPPECAAAAITTLRVLKEDWTEVVTSQATRKLERRLDSLEHELRKPSAQGGSLAPLKDTMHARRASHNLVKTLAMLCDAVARSHRRAEAREAEIASALRTLGVEVAGECGSSTGTPSTAPSTTPSSSVPGLGAADDAAKADGTGGAMSARSSNVSGDTKGGTGSVGLEALPGAHDCEAAVAAMATKTEIGMRKGLRLLGLPDRPLHYVPGLEMRLCGHDIHIAVNTMVGHWREDEKVAFHEVLMRIRRIVQQPVPDEPAVSRSDLGDFTPASANRPFALAGAGPEELLKQKANLTQERQALLEKLHSIDACLTRIDAQISQLSTPLRLDAQLDVASPQSKLPPDFKSLVASVAAALTGEARKSMERHAAQMQQRRWQLISGLSSHLEREQECIQTRGRGAPFSSASGTAVTARTAGPSADQVQESLREARELCQRVEAVTGGKGSRLLDALSHGRHCRAKWIDGKLYDATIQNVLGDGTVVVNWLRPRAAQKGTEEGGNPERQPLITISEAGGDDTVHRIVMTADVHLDAGPDKKAAYQLFQERVAEDLICVDCGVGNDVHWASISFGIYLCRACAEVHQKLGLRASVVRGLNDGWGWPARDLEYMRRGGNARFLECLRHDFAALLSLPPRERYVSRFAEFYRRRLDALCVGGQAPQAPTAESAGQPSTAKFLSAAEAAAVAQDMSQRFEATVRAAHDGGVWAGLPPRSSPPVQPHARHSNSSPFPSSGRGGIIQC